MTSPFKPGDRVLVGDRPTRPGYKATIVGPDLRFGLVCSWVVWPDFDDPEAAGQWVSFPARVLTLIPDTVTVTVELPRDEADAIRKMWGSDPGIFNTLTQKAAARVGAAVREALR